MKGTGIPCFGVSEGSQKQGVAISPGIVAASSPKTNKDVPHIIVVDDSPEKVSKSHPDQRVLPFVPLSEVQNMTIAPMRSGSPLQHRGGHHNTGLIPMMPMPPMVMQPQPIPMIPAQRPLLPLPPGTILDADGLVRWRNRGALAGVAHPATHSPYWGVDFDGTFWIAAFQNVLTGQKQFLGHYISEQEAARKVASFLCTLLSTVPHPAPFHPMIPPPVPPPNNIRMVNAAQISNQTQTHAQQQTMKSPPAKEGSSSAIVYGDDGDISVDVVV